MENFIKDKLTKDIIEYVKHRKSLVTNKDFDESYLVGYFKVNERARYAYEILISKDESFIEVSDGIMLPTDSGVKYTPVHNARHEFIMDELYTDEAFLDNLPKLLKTLWEEYDSVLKRS